MRIELQAAILSGVISGAVVLLGVLASELLTRQRQRRERAEQSIYQLVPLLGAEERMLREAHAGEAVSSQLRELHSRCLTHLFEIRTIGGRSLEPVRDAAGECIARSNAALLRYTEGIVMTESESLGGRQLTAAMFPAGSSLTDRVQHLRREGLPPGRDVGDEV